jgi:hypothetical protein
MKANKKGHTILLCLASLTFFFKVQRSSVGVRVQNIRNFFLFALK